MRKLLNSLNSLLSGLFLFALTSTGHAAARDEIVKNLREGQLVQAAKLVAAERKSNPKDVDTWFLEGVVQAQSGQTEKAIATFTQITQAHPQHAESFNNLGVLAAAKGQLSEARTYFEKALRTNPSYAAVHKNLGDVNSQLAKSAYSKALLADANKKPATVQLSMLASTAEYSGPAHAMPESASAKPTTVEAAVVPPPPATEPVKAPTPPKVAEPVKPVAPVQTPAITAPAPSAGVKLEAKPSATKPIPSPAPTTTEPAASEEAERKQVEEALRSWAKAWSRKDMGQYLAAYSANFDPPGKMNRKTWEEERRIRIVGKRSIRVELSQFRIRVKGTQAQAQFTQQYDSDSFKGRSTKTLSLVKEKGHWLISSETAKPL